MFSYFPPNRIWQFTICMKCQIRFSEKNMKTYFRMVSDEIFTQHAKCYQFTATDVPCISNLSEFGSLSLHCLRTHPGIISRRCQAKLLFPPASIFFLRYRSSFHAPQFCMTDQNLWYSPFLWLAFTHFGWPFLSGHHSWRFFSWTTQGAQKQSGNSSSPSICWGSGKWPLLTSLSASATGMNQWMNEWTNEWKKEWMNECFHVANKSIKWHWSLISACGSLHRIISI